ncbi:flagellar motor switch protein FliN [Candidatus Margulisiibacteriota bacterium]
MDARRIQFPQLQDSEGRKKIADKTLGDIPLQVTVELGTTDMTLKEILSLKEGSVIELNKLAGESLDLKVSDQLVAQGEVIVVDENYALKITNVFIKK